MSITRVKPKALEKAVSDFIAGAPDSLALSASGRGEMAPEASEVVSTSEENRSIPRTKGVRKGRKLQISLTISPSLLDKVDAMAMAMGQSRAALITMALHQAVERGVSLPAASTLVRHDPRDAET